MPSFAIAQAGETPWTAFPAVAGVSGGGGLRTQALIHGPERPLSLWIHQLAPGARIHWDAPPVAHGVYVLAGGIECEARQLGEAGAVICEHGGSLSLYAGADRATLAHFHRAEGHPEPPERPGGHAHVLGREGILRVEQQAEGGPSFTAYADSGCPTCEVWLHRSSWTPDRASPRHCHSEDEVLLVTAGAMKLGRRTLTRGSALAVDRGTVYAFRSGPEGLSFINYRSNEPFFIPVSRHGRGKPRSERLGIRQGGRRRTGNPLARGRFSATLSQIGRDRSPAPPLEKLASAAPPSPEGHLAELVQVLA